MTVSKIKKIILNTGPGIIVAAVVLGPGSVTVASKIGSIYGTSLIWVVVLAAISMTSYTSMSTRIGVMIKETPLAVIGNNYGRWLAVLIGIFSFFAAASFQFGNNLGVGMGMHGLTGINESIWPFVFTPLAILLIFFAKNLYKLLEKIITAMVLILILSFAANLLVVRPDIISVLSGLIPSFTEGFSSSSTVGLVGTTFVLHAAIYQAYLIKGKKILPKNLSESVAESRRGISILAIVSIIIMVTSATVLMPRGLEINTVSDMIMQLETLYGDFSGFVFSLGLVAAAFSSLMINSIMGGGLLADGLGLGNSLDQKYPKLFTLVILLIGMLIATLFKGNIVHALILAQGSSILGVPLIAVGIVLLANNKKLMSENRNTVIQNVLAALGFILIIAMVIQMYQKLLGMIQ